MSFCYSTIGFGLGVAKVIGNGTIKGSIGGVPTPTTAQKVWRVSQGSGDIAFAYPYSLILLEIQGTLKSPPAENKTMPSIVDSTSLPGSGLYQAAEMQQNPGLPAMLDNQHGAGVALRGVAEGQYLNRTGDQILSGFQVPIAGSLYSHFAHGASDSVTQDAARPDPYLGRNFLGNPPTDLPGYQKAYLEALLVQQRLQYGMPFVSKSVLNGFYGNPAFGLGMHYQANPTSSSILSSLGPGSPLRQNDRLSRFPSVMKSISRGSAESWNLDYSTIDEGFVSSLLDEFKNNKTRSFELSDIVDYVVEFSMDQYGSIATILFRNFGWVSGAFRVFRECC